MLDGPYAPGGVGLALACVVMAAMLVAALPINISPSGAVIPSVSQRRAASAMRGCLAHGPHRPEPDDLELAVRTLDAIADLRESEPARVYKLAADHAFDRHIGLTCGGIMFRDVVTARFGAGLEEARALRRTAYPA